MSPFRWVLVVLSFLLAAGLASAVVYARHLRAELARRDAQIQGLTARVRALEFREKWGELSRLVGQGDIPGIGKVLDVDADGNVVLSLGSGSPAHRGARYVVTRSSPDGVLDNDPFRSRQVDVGVLEITGVVGRSIPD